MRSPSRSAPPRPAPNTRTPQTNPTPTLPPPQTPKMNGSTMSDTTSFRSVLRGYDPAQVDQWQAEHGQALEQARKEAAERTVEVSQLRSELSRTQDEQARTTKALQSLKDEQRRAAAPTFADLGERIGSILTLADEEAGEIRKNAQADAQTLAGTSKLAADQTR